MPRSKLVEIQENTIIIDPRYEILAPKENLLVILQPQTSHYAIIDLYELRVLQNTLDRKSVIPSIILALSNTSEQQNNNGKKSKSKKSKKNGNKTVEPPSITMLKFIKPKTKQQTQLQQQSQSQNQQQPQQQNQNQ